MLNRFLLSGAAVLGLATVLLAADEAKPAAPAGREAGEAVRVRERANRIVNFLNEEEAAIIKAERAKIRQAVEAYREKSGAEAMDALKKQLRESQTIINATEKQATARLEDGPLKKAMEHRIERMEKNPDQVIDQMAQRMTRQGRQAGENGRARNLDAGEKFRGRNFKAGGFDRALCPVAADVQAACKAENKKLQQAAEPAKAAIEELKKQVTAAMDARLARMKESIAKMEDGPAKKRAELRLKVTTEKRAEMETRMLLRLVGVQLDDQAPGMGEGFGAGARPGRDGDAPRRGQDGDAPRRGMNGDAPRRGQDGDAPRRGMNGDAPRRGGNR